MLISVLQSHMGRGEGGQCVSSVKVSSHTRMREDENIRKQGSEETEDALVQPQVSELTSNERARQSGYGRITMGAGEERGAGAAKLIEPKCGW